MECGAYSFGVSEKQNNELLLCVLCAFAVEHSLTDFFIKSEYVIEYQSC